MIPVAVPAALSNYVFMRPVSAPEASREAWGAAMRTCIAPVISHLKLFSVFHKCQALNACGAKHYTFLANQVRMMFPVFSFSDASFLAFLGDLCTPHDPRSLYHRLAGDLFYIDNDRLVENCLTPILATDAEITSAVRAYLVLCRHALLDIGFAENTTCTTRSAKLKPYLGIVIDIIAERLKALKCDLSVDLDGTLSLRISS
eukprot:ANDGO_05467.mRNA.1 hypothetical protein